MRKLVIQKAVLEHNKDSITLFWGFFYFNLSYLSVGFYLFGMFFDYLKTCTADILVIKATESWKTCIRSLTIGIFSNVMGTQVRITLQIHCLGVFFPTRLYANSHWNLKSIRVSISLLIWVLLRSETKRKILLQSYASPCYPSPSL